MIYLKNTEFQGRIFMGKFDTYKNCYNINGEVDLSMLKNSSKREIKNCINEIKLYKNANFNSILKMNFKFPKNIY